MLFGQRTRDSGFRSLKRHRSPERQATRMARNKPRADQILSQHQLLGTRLENGWVDDGR